MTAVVLDCLAGGWVLQYVPRFVIFVEFRPFVGPVTLRRKHSLIPNDRSPTISGGERIKACLKTFHLFTVKL